MTNDNFTEAARAEAERQYPALNPDTEELTYPRSALREHKRSAHVEGWKAARTHLAAQKPTDYQIDVAMDAYAEASGRSVSRPWMEAAIDAYESAARRDEEAR